MVTNILKDPSKNPEKDPEKRSQETEVNQQKKVQSYQAPAIKD